MCGSFVCSDERLTKMQQAIVWGTKSNFVDIPTDCPSAMSAWLTGDIALFAPTAAWNFDTSRFFDKWLLDVKAEQGRGGGIPMIVPKVKIPGQFEQMFTIGCGHWGCLYSGSMGGVSGTRQQSLTAPDVPRYEKVHKSLYFLGGTFSAQERSAIYGNCSSIMAIGVRPIPATTDGSNAENGRLQPVWHIPVRLWHK